MAVFPNYPTVFGTVYQTCDSAHESVVCRINGTLLSEFEDYAATLRQQGFVPIHTHRIADNRFETFRSADGKTCLFLSHYPSSHLTRIVQEPCGYLPMALSPTDRLTVPSVTQLGREGAKQSAAGNSCIVQLPDGRFLMIDGGPKSDADADRLFAFLSEHTPHDEKPVIAAWFITHAHKDHVGLAGDFLRRYGDVVDVRLAAFNFPDFQHTVIARESAADMASYAAPFCNEIRRKGIPVWRLHSGQCQTYSDCTVEVLYTQEDVFPSEFAWGNHTSCALMITVCEKRFLVLGDSEKTLCEQMALHYRDTLKCDILQLSHHGLNGACLSLYQYADPDICFWPIDGERFKTHPICLGLDPLYDFNAWIRDESVRHRKHYHADDTHTVVI